MIGQAFEYGLCVPMRAHAEYRNRGRGSEGPFRTEVIFETMGANELASEYRRVKSRDR
jgi:hypothetical protein